MEVLIAEVQKRRVLWDKSSSHYKDKSVVEKEWAEVANNVGISQSDARKKWRNLRDIFSREIKKIPKLKSGYMQDCIPVYKGKWQYFTSMMFLKDTLKPRNIGAIVSDIQPSIEVSFGETSEDISESKTAPENSTTLAEEVRPSSWVKNATQNQRQKRLKEESAMEVQLLEIENTKRAMIQTEEDENSLFFRSLLPYMKNFNPLQQLRVRTKFQQILMDEMNRNQQETSYNTTTPGTSIDGII